MSSCPLAVRPLTGDEQLNTFYRLATETFIGSDQVHTVAAAFREYDERGPDFDPSQRRGVVEDGRLLGAYIMHERRMSIGPSRLSTACIAAVVTQPNERGRGIGRMLMEDATTHAQNRGHALLLLDGIPNFYRRFGYTDVFDETEHAINVAMVPPMAPAGLQIRPATLDDASELHALYRRHRGPYAGNFAWTLAHTTHRLWFQIERARAPIVVEDAPGSLVGYFYADEGSNRAFEVAADTRPATLALLQYHAPAATAEGHLPPAIWWRIPSDSRTLYLLADNLEGPAAVPRGERTPAIRSLTRQQSNEGWLARPASLFTLLDGMLPVWRERWARSNKPYEGALELCIDEERFALTLSERTVEVHEGSVDSAPTIELSPEALTQLVFGYRPVWWIANEQDQRVPSETRPVLEALFPPGGFWIAGIDAF
jgi:predicted N-acetyltransferase YhbS